MRYAVFFSVCGAFLLSLAMHLAMAFLGGSLQLSLWTRAKISGAMFCFFAGSCNLLGEGEDVDDSVVILGQEMC